MKKFIKKKKFKIFPDKIIELIGVFELVMEKKQEQQLVEKTTRRQLLQTKAWIPDELALGGITFYELGHKDASCLSEQGLIILQGSFNLASWKNQSIDGV